MPAAIEGSLADELEAQSRRNVELQCFSNGGDSRHSTQNH